MRRVPEVVQTSAMDCGPAVLTSLLRGHRLDADLEGVRDLCATGVDGTSIDVLTELARSFGLRARQLVVPADHLVSPALELLPAVVVTELPGGLLHFVVVWRRWGRWVMVMDPAVGRRWMTLDSLLAQLYRHEMPVGTGAWRHYAGTDAFTGPLVERLRSCGVSDADARRLVEDALALPQAGPIARLDAVARRGVRLGHRAGELLAALDQAAWSDLDADAMVVADVEGDVDANGELSGLVMRGVVVVSVDGADPDVDVPASLAERVMVRAPSPWATLWELVAVGGLGRLGVSVGALFVGSVGSIAVAYLLSRLVVAPTGGLLAVIGAVLLIAAGLNLTGTAGVIGAGRKLELELRRRLEDRVGRLPDQFFASRPSSDLAERAHAIHRLRELAASVADLAVGAGQAAAAAVVLLAVSPGVWWAVVLLVVAVGATSVGLLPALANREHRARTIAGALSHVYLDSLIGALPVRAHRAAAAVGVEHGELLEGWQHAERSRHRINGMSAAATLVVGYSGAALVVAVSVESLAGELVDVALVAFLSFVIVNASVVVTRTLRRIAPQWVVAQRLLALSTVDLDPEPATEESTGPAGFELRGVTVDGVGSGGSPVLDSVSLSIAPGEHLGIVGPSGAGKSTLVAAILGWVIPGGGEVLLDGRSLTADRAVGLRRSCGWIDPDVSIWSGSLAENIAAAEPGEGWRRWSAPLGMVPVVDRLGGEGGQVGEAGRLLSGGEGQRVRLTRLFARSGVRLVVLDEATRGLDEELRRSVQKALGERFAGVTTVSVTHDVDEAIEFDRVVYIDGGRVLADGAPTELLADPANPFTQMVQAHRALDESLGPAHGWSSAQLNNGNLILDNGTHGSSLPTSQPPVEDDPGRRVSSFAEPNTVPIIQRPRPRRDSGVAVPAAVGAVAAMALEWATFLGGWSAMLSPDRSWWWPVLFVVAGASSGGSVWLLGVAAVNIGARLRRRLLAGGVEAPLDHVRASGSGDLIGRVLEAESFEQHAVTGTADALIGAAQVLAALAVLVLADGPLVTAVLMAAWFGALIAAAAFAIPARRAWANERVDRTRLLLERFRGHRTESVYGPPPRATSGHLARYRKLSSRSDRWKRVLLVNAEFWMLAAVVLTALVATDGSLLAGLGAALLAWSGFGSLGVAFDDLVTARAASGVFRQLVHDDPDNRPPADLTRSKGGEIRLHDVRFAHPSAHRPLLDINDLAVQHGTRLVLRGDSGSGKSTLGTLLAGLRTPTTGVVLADDVVYVPQFGDNHTFQSTVAFNLLMGRRWPPGDAELDDVTGVLDALGLRDVCARMPRGLAQPVGESGWQLSHGERGRLYLARALLQNPEVIILDESLEGLDPRTARHALDTVATQIPTVILITHR